MKLKTLTIQNIASIENDVIEFAGDKLGSQDLFLICGPTGSGKTTILDAICLALFNKTPRIEGASRREVINTFADGDAPNKLNDPLHLVRKNKVNATVTLTFEADGHEYTARWHAYRTGQYRKGKETTTFEKLTLAQKVARRLDYEWSLTDDQGHEYYKDVDKEIVRVIKMTFDQFCKTTMLAQGDFTRFLISSSDEKAQILERMVGTEQYSEVGRVINRMAIDKKNEVDVLCRELENFVFLTDEQKVAKTDEIAELTEKIKTLAGKKIDIDKQIQWISDYVKANASVAAARASIDATEQALNSDTSKNMYQTVGLWDTTAQVRDALSTIQKCDAADKAAAAKTAKLKAEYTMAVDSQLYCTNQREQLIEANQALMAAIEPQRKFAEMFAMVDVICSKHDAIESNNRFISVNTSLLEKFDQTIAELQDKIDGLNKQKQEANAEIEELEKQAREHTDRLKEHGADTIDQEINTLNSQKTILIKLENALKARDNARTEFTAKQQTVRDTEADLERLKAEQEKALADAQQAQKALAESRAIYDKAYISLDDHARALRAKLTDGDECPICGRTIEHLLDETELRNILAPLKEKCDSDESHVKTTADLYAQAKAHVTSTSKSLTKAREDEKRAQTALTKCETELENCCTAAGIVNDDNIEKSVADIKGSIDRQEHALAERQREIRAIRSQIQQCTDSISTIRSLRITPIDNQLADTQKGLDRQRQKKAQTSGAIDKAKSAIESDRASMAEMISPEWEPQNADNVMAELKAAAKAYTESIKAHSDNQVIIDKLTRELELTNSCRQSVLALFPAWGEYSGAEAGIPSSDIGLMWTGLQSEANLLASTIRENADKRKAAGEIINEFTSTNPDIALSDIEKLLQLNPNDIASIRRELADLAEAHSNAKALYDEAVKRRAELSVSGGEMATLSVEELTQLSHSLSAETEALTAQGNECAELKGRRQKELETDEDNRRLHGDKKAKLDAKRLEYAEWEKLNRYLGSTDGKNFRNIAQSFILADLLDKANAYLANISSRYQLFCHPGTLTIMMRDAYQGGIERPTNTLSGGESFIISLSLALGLSSMQNVDFEVDTLFIDEGFGTLSPEFLEPVIKALKRLHATYGRRVGIISHVETLKQSIPVTIEVIRQGTSASHINIT